MKPSAWWMAAAAAALLAAPAQAADDDLTVVKKAVASSREPTPQPPALEEPPAAPARKAGKPEPQWLRIRAFEKDAKGENRKRVSVNVPLALVRALDDFPIDLCHHRWREGAKDSGRRCEMKLADVLTALEAGQELVEVDGENETVKIWVE